MKRLLLLTVRDKHGAEWCFEVREDPAHLAEWHRAGLDVVVIEARIPALVADLGLASIWAAGQGAWKWLRFW